MKRTRIYESICIIIIIIVICKVSFGQWNDLEIETYTETYTELENAQHVYYNAELVLQTDKIPVGFSFSTPLNSDKAPPDSVTVNYNGSVTLKEYQNGSSESLYTYGIDFIDRYVGTGEYNSLICYSLEGNTGDHILKIEWKNMGFKREYEIFGTTDSYTNVQLWLYESQPYFEVRVGPTYSYYTQPPQPLFEHGPMIGYYAVVWDQYQNPSLWKQLLSGDPADPVIGTDWYLESLPEEGMVYRFNSLSLITTVFNTQEVNEKIKVYPNPVSVSATLSYTNRLPGKVNLSVYNMGGRRLDVLVDRYETAGKYQVLYNTTHLPAGNYVGVLTTSEGIQKTKMIVIK